MHGVYSGKQILPAAIVFRPDAVICDIAISDHHLMKPCDSAALLELLAPLRSRNPLP
jgi:hypothetical protein